MKSNSKNEMIRIEQLKEDVCMLPLTQSSHRYVTRILREG